MFIYHLILPQRCRVGVVSQPNETYASKHLQSAISDPEIVLSLIQKKRVDNQPVFNQYVDSPPLPKTKHLIIFDLSASNSGLVASNNSLIPPEPFSLQYATADRAIKLIKLAGQGSSQTDITEAFK